MTPEEAGSALRGEGLVRLAPGEARSLLDPAGTALSGAAWDRFVATWDDLREDAFMADRGRYRLRRHAVFSAGGDGTGFDRKADQPHYQALEHNPLNGGVARRFAPVEAGDGPALRAVMAGALGTFAPLSPPGTRWRVEVHQFRILARGGEAGKPTPEGMHRDGVDWVLVSLVGRANVEGGVTAVSGTGGGAAHSFTLADPLDTVLLDDRRVRHGVTPVVPLDPSLPGHRDVLVVTFAAAA